jgi:hypothetical protein
LQPSGRTISSTWKRTAILPRAEYSSVCETWLLENWTISKKTCIWWRRYTRSENI